MFDSLSQAQCGFLCNSHIIDSIQHFKAKISSIIWRIIVGTALDTASSDVNTRTNRTFVNQEI